MKRKIGLIVLILLLSWGNVYAAPKSPDVVISNYTVGEEGIAPGSPFTITLDLKNFGEHHARKVKITLNNEQGQENLGNFSPIHQSNVEVVSIIEAGKTKQVSYDLYVSPRIEPGNYNVMVNLSYMNNNGVTYEETQTIGLLVKEKESIEIMADDDLGDIVPGESLEGEIQIVNNSVSEIKGVSVSLEGEGLDSQREYFGNFSSGDYDIYNFLLTGEEPGEHRFKVIVKYISSINEESTVEKEITYHVAGDEVVQGVQNEEDGGSWFTKFIRGLFGL